MRKRGIGAKRVEPSRAICPLVKSDDICEAYIDYKTVSCASPSDSYTLTRECLKCGNQGSTRLLKDQSTQNMSSDASTRECWSSGKKTREQSTQTAVHWPLSVNSWTAIHLFYVKLYYAPT